MIKLKEGKEKQVPLNQSSITTIVHYILKEKGVLSVI